jgi:hypothetical protein
MAAHIHSHTHLTQIPTLSSHHPIPKTHILQSHSLYTQTHTNKQRNTRHPYSPSHHSHNTLSPSQHHDTLTLPSSPPVLFSIVTRVQCLRVLSHASSSPGILLLSQNIACQHAKSSTSVNGLHDNAAYCELRWMLVLRVLVFVRYPKLMHSVRPTANCDEFSRSPRHPSLLPRFRQAYAMCVLVCMPECVTAPASMPEI